MVWAAAGNVTYAACQWGILVVLAKLASAEDVGRFALGLALTAPIMIAAGLQLRVVQATDARGDHAFGTYLAVRLLATALALGCIAVVAATSGRARATMAVVALIGVAKAFEALSDVVFGLLQQHERIPRIARSMIAKGVLSVAAVAVGLALTGSVVVATLAMALAWGTLLVAYDLPAARRLAAIRPRFDRRRMAALVWLALPMGCVAGLQSLMTNVPRYAIEAHGGARALGHFAALAYLMLAGNQPVMGLWTAVSPRLARLYVTDAAGYRRLTHRTLGLAAGMGALMVAATLACGRPLLTVLYAPEYAEHANVLTWLAAVGAVGYVASALCCSITAARRFPAQLAVAALTLATSWAATTVLVPRWGLTGAAWALLAATVTQTACLALVYARASAAAGPGVTAARTHARRPPTEAWSDEGVPA